MPLRRSGRHRGHTNRVPDEATPQSVIEPTTSTAEHSSWQCEIRTNSCTALCAPPARFALATHIPFLRPSQEAGRYLEAFFARSVRYFGPLRDEPKAIYPLNPVAHHADVGLKGEHTAAVLDLHRHTVVKYVPSAAFQPGGIRRLVASAKLGEAVDDWLQYLGVAEKVESRSMGKFGHQLAVNVQHAATVSDLTHVGVGVSQALPIVVTSLLAKTDTTLILEQPELHLHPSVQTLLGDFFLSMALLEKQCIVETHSEYIVNRVRLRTAMLPDDWENPARVYFVERNQQGKAFREVVVNEYGAITEWPKGFFDHSQREAESILRAATVKRKAQRAKETRR